MIVCKCFVCANSRIKLHPQQRRPTLRRVALLCARAQQQRIRITHIVRTITANKCGHHQPENQPSARAPFGSEIRRMVPVYMQRRISISKCNRHTPAARIVTRSGTYVCGNLCVARQRSSLCSHKPQNNVQTHCCLGEWQHSFSCSFPD